MKKNCKACGKVLDIYEDCCDCGSVLFTDKYEPKEEVKEEIKVKKGKKEVEKEINEENEGI